MVPSLLNLSPASVPIPPLEVVTEPQVEFPESYSESPLAIYFTYAAVYLQGSNGHIDIENRLMDTAQGGRERVE